MKSISWKNLVRVLLKLGFSGPISGGKHPFMIKGNLVLTLPNPHGRDIGVGLLKRILKQAKIDREEWDRNV